MDRSLALSMTLALASLAPCQSRPTGESWLLQIEGNARELRVTHASRKPFAVDTPSESASPFSIELLDESGSATHRVPIDLTHFCTDRDHAGQAPHMRGGRIVDHDIVCRAKIPALDGTHSIRIVRTDGEQTEVVQTVSAGELPRLLPNPKIPPAVRTIENNGPSSNRYDIVILAEGYQQHERNEFDKDAIAAVDHLFDQRVFAAYRQFFNVHTVFRASQDSGADHPLRTPPTYVDTAYDATYNYSGTPRCLYIQDRAQASADALLAPDVESSIMVLVNDNAYGGCGGSYSVSYTGPLGPAVQTHEFGHSFGGLADEYDTGQAGTYVGPEPSEPNVTTDPSGAKWSLWLGTQGVGAFQGAKYFKRGIWRPKINCTMRANAAAFCPVCEEQLVLRAHTNVNAIEPVSPVGPVTVHEPHTVTFSVKHLINTMSTVTWSVNGQTMATGNSFTWDPSSRPSGRYQVAATATDQTPFVRKDLNNARASTATWAVDVRSQMPGRVETFGSSCASSLLVPCLTMNETATPIGGRGFKESFYAFAVTLPSESTIRGFDLYTDSLGSNPVTIDIALFAANASGSPGTLLRYGTMTVGTVRDWCRGMFRQPYQASAGEKLFLSFRNPKSEITLSIRGSQRIESWQTLLDESWVGPSAVSWAYRLRCQNEAALVPVLTASGFPEPASSFEVKLDQGPANGTGALLLGTSRSAWGDVALPLELASLGAPSCQLLTSVESVQPITLDSNGCFEVDIAIPASTTLTGVQLFGQAWLRDPEINASGSVWTNGFAATIGK